jgi:uncharacterized FAD-dependent dehydrogenase
MDDFSYRINEVKLRVGEDMDRLPDRIERLLRLKKGTIKDWRVMRESIDARDKSRIRLIYTVDFTTDGDLRLTGREMKKYKVRPYRYEGRPEPVPGTEKMTGRPVIVGFGPCGIFAALELARAGYRPVVLERGRRMEERVRDVDAFRNRGALDPESNVLFGEGGAGTFSDGKLTSGIKDAHIRYVLETFAAAGAGEDILYKNRPHIGTDVLRRVIVCLRKKIESLGGEIRFGAKLSGFTVEDGAIRSAHVIQEGGEYDIETSALILATGHSARDTFRLVRDEGLDMEQKPFSIGVRIEHPQEVIDRAQYGEERRLPPADYKVSCRTSGGRGVYSFCMCPGGEVIVCSTQDGELCVNGMSRRARDSGTANSGVLCDVRTSDFGSDDVLAGVAFQEKYERLAFENGGGGFRAPSCSMKDFLGDTVAAAPVKNSLPGFAYDAIREAVPQFAKKIRGYDMDGAKVTAVETRSSSPVRILRGPKESPHRGESSVAGIYPAGEGAGYAGGITSAACDGIRAADIIIEKYAVPSEV